MRLGYLLTRPFENEFHIYNNTYLQLDIQPCQGLLTILSLDFCCCLLTFMLMHLFICELRMEIYLFIHFIMYDWRDWTDWVANLAAGFARTQLFQFRILHLGFCSPHHRFSLHKKKISSGIVRSPPPVTSHILWVFFPGHFASFIAI